ncbi:MAG: protein kinase [Chloroflexota bacterium]
MFIDLDLTSGVSIGAYQTIELIGKGGFAEIWSGMDSQFKRLVAIKVIPRYDAYSTIQFKRESGMISRLDHPNILPLYDFGEVSKYRYLTMPYLTGGSLAQRLEEGRLPLDEIVALIRPIASALDYIHTQHIVHRDLKPGNILLDAQGFPYLTDFGLAKEITDETMPMHSVSGTLTYMPPEQFSGSELSDRSDQYSFGILLYQLFTGQLPYEGRAALGMRQLNADTDERLQDITLVDPTLPVTLNDLLGQLTDPDPINRPPSAVKIAQDITAILQGLPGSHEAAKTNTPYALASDAYRQLEAKYVIDQYIIPWSQGQFSVRLTHFVLLDSLLRSLSALVTPDVRTLMLRGALEYNQQIDYWWEIGSEAERQQACWHAVLNGDSDVSLKALRLVMTVVQTHATSQENISAVGKRLLPLSDFTPVALEFLEKSLPTSKKWADEIPQSQLNETDDNLCTVAMSDAPLAHRAAVLIGTARRTHAVIGLHSSPGQRDPIFIAYETAGSLPSQIALMKRLRLMARLAVLQLTRQPLTALSQYAWAVLGNVLAFALIVYLSFRSSDSTNFFAVARLLNTLGYGLIFGLIYATGIWVGRHISQRLRVVPFWLRAVFGTAVGGLIVAWGFILFNRLVYANIDIEMIMPTASIINGWLYVAGFVVSVNLPVGIQILLGALGIAVAYLLPWLIYLTNPDAIPPFIFDDTYPYTAFALSGIAALVAAFVTLGYCWRDITLYLLNRKHSTGTLLH